MSDWMKTVNWKKVATVIGVALLVAAGAVKFDVITLKKTTEEPLVIAMIPTEDADTTRAKAELFRQYMAQCMDTKVLIQVSVDYTAVVEAAKFKHADVVKLGGFTYIMGVDEAGLEAIAMGVRAKTGLSTYHSILVTSPDSGVGNIEDLAGKKVAFADPGSTSGYLAPFTALKEAGIEPAETTFAGGHDASVLATINNHVDAAATSDVWLNTAIKDGMIAEDSIVVIWESDPIPGGPMAVRSDMNDDLKKEIQACVCSAPQEAVEGFHHGRIRYVPAVDADFDVVREMAKYKE